MQFKVGQKIWLLCKVKPGAFSDERMVLIPSDFGDWLGFVPVFSLKDDILEGETKVKAVVFDIENGIFRAVLPGDAVAGTLYEGKDEGQLEIGSI